MIPKNQRLFTAFYPFGSCGSFLIYFINLHKNFKHINIEFKNETYNPKKVVFYHDFENENSHISLKLSSFNVGISIKDFLRQINYDKNKKLAFKMMPHTHVKVSLKKYSEIINIINIYIDHQYSWYSDRLKRLSPMLEPWDHNLYNLSLNNITEFLNKKNFNYIDFNIRKFLLKDNLEYQKLLQFINEEPLDGWQNIINEYVNTVGLDLSS